MDGDLSEDKLNERRLIDFTNKTTLREREWLMIKHCELQIKLFKVRLKHSETESEWYVNYSSIVFWEESLNHVIMKRKEGEFRLAL